MSDILCELFTIIFGFAFSFMLSTALKVFYGGVGLIYQIGFKGFIIRSGIIGTTFVISGVYFFHAYRFIKSLPATEKLLINYYKIILVTFLSMGPWLSYHIARIIFFPFVEKLLNWKSLANNVDVIFIVMYIVLFIIALLGFKIICKLYKIA